MAETDPAGLDKTDTDWERQRDEAKACGDAAFRAKQFDAAIQAYTTALSVDPDNAKLLSNRSAAYLLDNQKSKALHDAQKCVEINTMGVKGQSRLAAALQALGRYEPARMEWQGILKLEPQHAGALRGVNDCDRALQQEMMQKRKKEEQEKLEKEREEEAQAATKQDSPEDDLDDFFNDVEEAAGEVVRQKQEEAKDKPTEAIKTHKKDLGSSKEQIERLLAPNYKWRNLNPFLVLDISHTASEDDISRRYKALSLLLHPDKNLDNPKAQEAFDQVLKAKNMLKDENKANHVRQLVEQGLKQGKLDWEQQQSSAQRESLEENQSKAVQRIFAQVEHKRREVEDRQRKQEQRERQQEEEGEDKERQSRKFDKSWKQEERVGKRVGNWRDFQKTSTTSNKKPKTSS